MKSLIHNKFFIEKRKTLFLLFWSHHLKKYAWDYDIVELLQIGKVPGKLVNYAKVAMRIDPYIRKVTKQTGIAPKIINPFFKE